jgi:type IV pilus assembly protein PilM
MFFSKPNIIGLDIADTSISMCELKGTKEKITALKGGTRALPEGIVKDGKVKDSEKLSQEIIALKKETGISSSNCVIALPEADTFLHLVPLPPREKKGEAWLSQIVHEIQGTIPYPIEELFYDYAMQDGKAMVALAPKAIVEQYKEVLVKAKLQCRAIEPESVSLGRAVIHDANPALIIDLGDRVSTLTLFDKGKVYFSDCIRIAGNAFTGSIAEALGISYEEAEKKKQEYGFEAKTQAKLRDALERSFEPIIKEIEKVRDFFKEKTGQPAERILLTGGSSNLKGIVEYLQSRISGVSVQLASENIDPKVSAYGGSAVGGKSQNISLIAFGLSLRGNEQGINLLPKKKT